MADLLKYQEVESFLLEELSSGKFTVGDRFYTETEIAERFHLNSRTVRKAFAELVQSGFVVRMRRSGTFVNRLPERPMNPRLFNHCLIGILIYPETVLGNSKVGLVLYELEAAGYLTVITSGNPVSLIDAGIKGIIAVGGVPEETCNLFARLSIPLVVFSSKLNRFPGIPRDYQSAARELISFFLQHKTRSLALIGEGPNAAMTRDFFEPELQKAAATCGIQLTSCCGTDRDFGTKFRRLMSSPDHPDSLFALNSLCLGMVEQILRENDLVIGREISVVVHGSNALQIPSIPAYSIFDINIREGAQLLIQRLLELIRHPNSSPPIPLLHYAPVLDRGSVRKS